MKREIAFTIPGEKTGETQELQAPSGIPTALQGGLETSGSRIFQNSLNILAFIATLLAVIVIMYSGIQWVMSEGNVEKVYAAKRRLRLAVLGLLLVAGAYFAVRINFFNIPF